MAKLSPKQQRFVEEYLVDLNAAAAARRAGYSEKAARMVGCRLLTKVNIAAAIQEARARLSERTEVSQDRVVRELACVAFLDPRELWDWGPDGVTLKASTEISEDAARAVASVSETTTEKGGTIKATAHDKIAALDKLARHLGMFVDRSETDTATEAEMREWTTEMLRAYAKGATLRQVRGMKLDDGSRSGE